MIWSMDYLKIINKAVAVIICVLLIFSPSAYAAEPLTLYSCDGRELSIWPEELDTYKALGWYQVPVIMMYTPDGRSMAVDKAQVDAYKKVGWYTIPVQTVYAPDGRAVVIDKQELAAYQSVGWFTEPVALMNNGMGYIKYVEQSLVDSYKDSGWYIQDACNGLLQLKELIQNEIKKVGGQWGIYIKNLNTNEYLIVNDKDSYSSASIIKLFIMAAVYDEIAKGNISGDAATWNLLNNMITVSDNLSSNLLVKKLGGGNYKNGFDTENAHSYSIGCKKTQHQSLFIGYGDYVSYGRNLVEPQDCGLVLEKIYRRQLVSPEYSDTMLQFLKAQTRRSKIPYSLPYGTVTANKTGENQTVESDVGIVYSPACDYIICTLSNNCPVGIKTIRNISAMVYNYFNQ